MGATDMGTSTRCAAVGRHIVASRQRRHRTSRVAAAVVGGSYRGEGVVE
jgi:hypothetical protein